MKLLLSLNGNGKPKAISIEEANNLKTTPLEKNIGSLDTQELINQFPLEVKGISFFDDEMNTLSKNIIILLRNGRKFVNSSKVCFE